MANKNLKIMYHSAIAPSLETLEPYYEAPPGTQVILEHDPRRQLLILHFSGPRADEARLIDQFVK